MPQSMWDSSVDMFESISTLHKSSTKEKKEIIYSLARSPCKAQYTRSLVIAYIQLSDFFREISMVRFLFLRWLRVIHDEFFNSLNVLDACSNGIFACRELIANRINSCFSKGLLIISKWLFKCNYEDSESNFSWFEFLFDLAVQYRCIE